MTAISIVAPAYNEAQNLRVLYDRLCQTMQGQGVEWEWIVVDDHSTDDTFAVAAAIARDDARVRVIRLARNHGAFIAIACGLREARGDCAVALAADLQDPPELIPQLLTPWREGAQVVWAARRRREGETRSTIALARLYYFIMRRVFGMTELPAGGADFFLIDRRVLDALAEFHERNVSLIPLVTWMGFRQATIFYDKQPRLHGRSGWSIEKKLKLAVDSVTSFTYQPIRLMSYVGAVVALLGFLYAGLVAVIAVTTGPPQGWSSLMVVILVIGGIQMLMMGVLGEYLWRALDEARRRPRYLIEGSFGSGLPPRQRADAQ